MTRRVGPWNQTAYNPTIGRCLRLLFEREQGRWYLVAVVHGAWTI